MANADQEGINAASMTLWLWTESTQTPHVDHVSKQMTRENSFLFCFVFKLKREEKEREGKRKKKKQRNRTSKDDKEKEQSDEEEKWY